MAEYAGSGVVFIWSGTAGTVSLQGDCRTCAITPAIAKIDTTAGSDTSKQYLPSFVEWTVNWQGVAQIGTSGFAAGTSLLPGVLGTVTVYPYGSAYGVGSVLKFSMPAMCNGAVWAMPYSDVVTLACDFSTSSGGTGTWATA
jgi:hypothetical protein